MLRSLATNIVNNPAPTGSSCRKHRERFGTMVERNGTTTAPLPQ